MANQKIDQKNLFVVALLGFLIPGLGHLYQRRFFKGLLYAVCILGTFFGGMYLGDWKVVYFSWHGEKRTWAYLCQVWTGLPALPAIWQNRRVAQTKLLDHLMVKTEGPFQGEFQHDISHDKDLSGDVVGHVILRPYAQLVDHRFEGTFQGTLTLKGTTNDQHQLEGRVYGIKIEPRISPFANRSFRCLFQNGVLDGNKQVELKGEFDGSIPRSLFDRYAAPLHDDRSISDPTDLQRASDELARYFELGTVFTMIAGLLNILALYDALEGPAYEDGEENSDEAHSDKSTAKA